MMVDLIKAHPLVTVYDSALNSEQTEIVNNGLQGVMLGAMKPADLAAQLQATIK
jgi:raffinose/stachyose/melibiose transport system substrate-binding protein